MEKKQHKSQIILRFSIAILFVLATSLGFFYSTEAATMYISPNTGSYSAGQIFTATVYVSSPDQAENATQGIINFPVDKLEVQSVSKTNSILTLWVQEPVFSNAYGTVQFAGVVPNPGFMGNTGRVLSVTFKVISSGAANLNIVKGSVLANDGNGTQILTNVADANYKLLPEVTAPANRESTVPVEINGTPFAPKIFSTTHPDPSKWYNNTSPKFTWQVASDVSSDRMLFDKYPSAQPTVVYKPAITEKDLENVGDGIWYFHVQLKNENGWGSISNYRFQIDTQPPDPFTVKFAGGPSDNPQPQVFFTTTDSMSGIDHYGLKIGEADAFDVPADSLTGDPYALPVQAPGKRMLLVMAYDKAGNSVSANAEFTVLPINAPEITNYPTELNTEDALIIKGSTYANATVRIYLKKDDSDLIERQDIKTDPSGNFTIIWHNKLSSEIYKFWADVTDARGAKSNPTDTYVFSVKQTSIMGISSLIVNYIILVSTFILVVSAVVFILWELWRRLKKKLGNKTNRAEKMIHIAFDELRENMIAHVKLLEKVKTLRPLTKEENRLMIQLRKDVDNAEKLVGKEIQDIQRKVG